MSSLLSSLIHYILRFIRWKNTRKRKMQWNEKVRNVMKWNDARFSFHCTFFFPVIYHLYLVIFYLHFRLIYHHIFFLFSDYILYLLEHHLYLVSCSWLLYLLFGLFYNYIYILTLFSELHSFYLLLFLIKREVNGMSASETNDEWKTLSYFHSLLPNALLSFISLHWKEKGMRMKNAFISMQRRPRRERCRMKR